MPYAHLLSGGVDSSVALANLKEEGRDVTAFYLKVWLEDELAFLGDCPWKEDLEQAEAVCRKLDVPLEVVPLQSEYLDRVVTHTLDELRAGRTPSPDVICNCQIKFGAFVERAGKAFDCVTSGHYARVEGTPERPLLKRSPDPVKDQTYFLSRMTREQLSHVRFPIGHLMKDQVRERAKALDLPNQDRKDSQGICFLGKISYPDFIRFHLGESDGPIVDVTTGKELGRHGGYWLYTVGQRQGLGLSGGPWYVVAKDTERNAVFVVHQDHREEAAANSFEAVLPAWINDPPSSGSLRLKLRHGPHLVDCSVEHLAENRLRVEMADPDPGVAPGQYAVFYDDDVCLGSAVIANTVGSTRPPAVKAWGQGV